MASSVDLGPVETTTVNAIGMGARQAVTLGSSPCTLTNRCSTRASVVVSLGTGIAIDLSPDGATFDSSGLLGGQYILAPGGSVKITYVVAPTVSFWPI